jgi:dTDP-L-rhamnose 4-epimerase
MKVLITGGAGFIGSHLVDRFVSGGWSVRVLDNLQPRVHPRGLPAHFNQNAEFVLGDVRNGADWERALEGVDAVLHQAAYQDYVPDYSEFMATNVVGTALLFEVIARRRFPVRRVVFASSQAVYGEGQYQCPAHGFVLATPRSAEALQNGDWEPRCMECSRPLTARLLEEEHPSPLSPYGVSKFAQELTGLRLARMLEIPCVALRYSITQGPRQSLFNQYSGVARIFTLALTQNKSPVAYEDGLLQRDYVHVRDVVEANWLVMHDDRAIGQAFNVGSGIATTVIEYALSLAAAMGKHIEPEVPGIYRLGDARHSVSSIARLKGLGWTPSGSLNEIIGDFLAWVGTLGPLDSYISDAQEALFKLNVLRRVAGA